MKLTINSLQLTVNFLVKCQRLIVKRPSIWSCQLLTVRQRGFTLAEMVVIIAIALTMIAVSTISLLRAQQHASLDVIVDTFIADLKEQQVKAMVGETEGTNALYPYGIYFSSDEYTLFRDTYQAGNSANFTPDLGSSVIQITTTFPSAQVLFAKGTGEVTGATGNYTVTFTNTTTNEQKVVTVNRYGVVTGIEN